MEDAAQLRQKGRTFGLDLDAAEASGILRLMVLPGYDLEADHIAQLLRSDIERRGVQRLVIDSALEIDRAVPEPDRKPNFLGALVSYLRERQVTTLITSDLDTIVGPTLELSGVPFSVVAENLIIMRYAEYQGGLHRLLSVLKMRFSAYDATFQEYEIVAGQGIHLLGPAPAASGLLTGLPQIFSASTRGTADAGPGS